MRQVCDQLGLCIVQREQGAKSVLKIEGVTTPTGEQLEYAKKNAADEFFTKLSDCHRYRKIIKDMEKQYYVRKTHYPRPSVMHVGYGGHSIRTESNDGFAFATICEDKEEAKKTS